MDYRELYDIALNASKNAYVPYSGFHVGAAVLTEDLKIYCGANMENASYPVSLCAERTAMSKALYDGHRSFKAVAVAATKDGQEHSAAPCGMCRQFIFEFGDDIEIIFGENRDSLKIFRIKDLLPEGFRL
ncbi:MAG: cytidine deaminase [Bacillota bacterium]|nr:cytidine deaminase [Bacillota bacterium]